MQELDGSTMACTPYSPDSADKEIPGLQIRSDLVTETDGFEVVDLLQSSTTPSKARRGFVVDGDEERNGDCNVAEFPVSKEATVATILVENMEPLCCTGYPLEPPVPKEAADPMMFFESIEPLCGCGAGFHWGPIPFPFSSLQVPLVFSRTVYAPVTVSAEEFAKVVAGPVLADAVEAFAFPTSPVLADAVEAFAFPTSSTCSKPTPQLHEEVQQSLPKPIKPISVRKKSKNCCC